MIQPSDRENVYGKVCEEVLLELDRGYARFGAGGGYPQPPTGLIRKMIAEDGVATTVSVISTIVAALAGVDPQFKKLFIEASERLA